MIQVTEEDKASKLAETERHHQRGAWLCHQSELLLTMRQHVTDPEMCIRCSACEMACPHKAIEAIMGRYCIDHNLCRDCRKCIEECPTGAADCFIEVREPYTPLAQANWSMLPSE